MRATLAGCDGFAKRSACLQARAGGGALVYDPRMDFDTDACLLGAYALWGLCVNLALRAWLRRAERGSAATSGVERNLLHDPCEIAALRGGAQEVVRLAALATLLRGQAQVQGGRLLAVESPAFLVHRPGAERAVLEACATPIDGTALLAHPGALAGAQAAMHALRVRGLLAPGDAGKDRRATFALVALALAAPAAPLLLRFVQDGGSVLGAVGVLGPAAAGFAWQACADPQTGAAVRMLHALGSTHAAAAERVQRGGAAPEDVLLVAAVFGAQNLPEPACPAFAALFPLPPPSIAADAG